MAQISEDNAVRLLEDVYAVWQPQPYEATGYVGVHGIKPIWVNSKADVKQLQKLFNTILREKDFWRYAQRREQRKRQQLVRGWSRWPYSTP